LRSPCPVNPSRPVNPRQPIVQPYTAVLPIIVVDLSISPQSGSRPSHACISPRLVPLASIVRAGTPFASDHTPSRLTQPSSFSCSFSHWPRCPNLFCTSESTPPPPPPTPPTPPPRTPGIAHWFISSDEMDRRRSLARSFFFFSGGLYFQEVPPDS